MKVREENEVKRLCVELYHRKPEFFDLMLEHIPTPQKLVVSQVEQLVKKEKDLRFLTTAEGQPTYPKFTIDAWEKLSQYAGEIPRKAGAFYFEFYTGNKEAGYLVRLTLRIGYYHPEFEPRADLQRRLLAIVKKDQEAKRSLAVKSIFSGKSKAELEPCKNGAVIYSKLWISEKKFEKMSSDVRTETIQRRWEEFLKDDLKKLREAFDISALRKDIAPLVKAARKRNDNSQQ